MLPENGKAELAKTRLGPMLAFIVIIPAAIAWCVLALEGVRRGRRGETVVFRSWTDFALTAALVVPPLSLIVALPWIWITARSNRKGGDLWVVVPAKISLVLLAAICSVFAVSRAIAALSPKTAMRRRLADGAVAAGGAFVAWRVFQLIRKLVGNAAAQRGAPVSA
jgi:hypothetical protein